MNIPVISWGVRFRRDDNGYDSTDWYDDVAKAKGVYQESKRNADPNLHIQLILKVVVAEK